jgi:cytochrome c peroxidase
MVSGVEREFVALPARGLEVIVSKWIAFEQMASISSEHSPLDVFVRGYRALRKAQKHGVRLFHCMRTTFLYAHQKAVACLGGRSQELERTLT